MPKLEPVGVLRLVDPRPVNVIMRALPMPPKKVTELVPLPEQPAHVKTPDVEKVTGSALASDCASVTIARSNALIRVALNKPAMFTPLCFMPPIVRPHLPSTRDAYRMALLAPELTLMSPQPRDKRDCGKHVYSPYLQKRWTLFDLFPEAPAKTSRCSDETRSQQQHAGGLRNLLCLWRSCRGAELDYNITKGRIHRYSRNYESKCGRPG